MSNLDRAREWAKSVGKIEDLMSEPRAAVEVIQSLPNQWVDAEKLERILAGMNCCLEEGTETNFSDGFNEATTTWRDALKAPIPPNLPTLAELIEQGNDPQKYVGMQCIMQDFPTTRVITEVMDSHVSALREDLVIQYATIKKVTPLPDLPKLQWPGSEPESTHFDNLPDEAKQVMKESIEEYKTGQFVDFDSSPRPEDVPEGEPWIVQHEGMEGVGCRNEPESSLPWLLIRRDEHQFDYCYDTDITLVSRLVPEPPALPEGMRLADHPDFGRVVVSPWADDDEEYKVFFRDEDGHAGADSYYARKSNLTFLDGE